MSKMYRKYKIPKNIIDDNINTLITPEDTEIDYFGLGNNRINIYSNDLFKSIISNLKLGWMSEIINMTNYIPFKPTGSFNLSMFYISYNIDKEHIIDTHSDYCDYTLIIYINKTNTIKDEFFIEEEKVNDPWIYYKNNSKYYNLIIFNGYKSHNGIIKGLGKRDVIVIHFNNTRKDYSWREDM